MSMRRLGHIDLDTGEILEGGLPILLPPKRRNGFMNGWFAMANDALSVMKKFRRLEDFRVLIALLEKLDFENHILANQSEIAKDLEMDKAQVNRAIKRLMEAGAIFEGPKIGVSKSYKLNMNFGWKGSAKNHVTALDDYRKKRDQEITPNL